jgi:hypothetical protein
MANRLRIPPRPPRSRNAGGPPVEPPYKKLLLGVLAWFVWWLILGHRSVAGWIAVPAFLGVAESWPLFQTIAAVRAGRRRWSRPPGFWIAFYAFGSAWLVLLLTAILILPWSGSYAGATNAIVKIGGALTFAGALWLASRVGAGR